MKLREFAACALWASSFCTVIFGIIDSVREGHNSLSMPVGIYLGIVALAPTVWCIIDWAELRRSDSIEQIVEVVDAFQNGRRDVSKLH